MLRRVVRVGVAGAALVGAVAWFGGKGWAWGRLPVALPIVVTRAFVDVADTIRRYETLSDVFARQRIVGADFVNLLAQMEGVNPRRVRPNTVFEFRYPMGDSLPDRVRVRLNDEAFLRLDRADDGRWSALYEKVTWTVHTERVIGAIESTLNEAIHRAIADSVLLFRDREFLVWNLADEIYAWQIDFFRDIYPGDRFVVLYERLTSSLGEMRYGRVLAASVQTRGVENTAYVLTDNAGRNVYYDENARSLRRAFKMYPVQFRRISSSFGSRLHPVLRIRRAHLGVDYAAATGTRIEATSDGTVTRAGRWGGYGIMVSIRHPKGIETRYGHLRRLAPGIRPGVRVRQGQWIGSVGMSGLANGPHVHYEFLKNGRHLNPRRVDLGDGEPVPAARRAEFDSLRMRYDRLLGRASADRSVPVD